MKIRVPLQMRDVLNLTRREVVNDVYVIAAFHVLFGQMRADKTCAAGN